MSARRSSRRSTLSTPISDGGRTAETPDRSLQPRRVAGAVPQDLGPTVGELPMLLLTSYGYSAQETPTHWPRADAWLAFWTAVFVT